MNKTKARRGNQALAIIIAFAMIFAFILPFSQPANARDDPAEKVYDIGQGGITIEQGSAGVNFLKVSYGGTQIEDNISNTDTITIIGMSGNEGIRVQGGITASIKLRDISIDVSDIPFASAFEVVDGSNVSINLSGTNNLKSGSDRSGLEVTCGNRINITGTSRDLLTAIGGAMGAGIGGGGTIAISGGSVTALGGDCASGIGGCCQGDGGEIIISGGTVAATGGRDATDIGPGQYGQDGRLEISGPAEVFLRNDSCTAPDTTTHQHESIIGHTAGESIYGIPVDWDGDFGVYLLSVFFHVANSEQQTDTGEIIAARRDFIPLEGFDGGGTQPEGAGTRQNPYLIGTGEHLAWFAGQVNSGNRGIHGQLIASIELNDTTDWQDWGSDLPAGVSAWTPIGNLNQQFSGTFDGNGYTIEGIYVNGSSYSGLFGYVSVGSVIRNVHIIRSYIGASEQYAGGIAGYVKYGTVTNCSSDVKVSAAQMAGGIAGYLESGMMSNCFSTGSVNGRYAGGVVGLLGANDSGSIRPKMDNCYSNSTVQGFTSVGGLVGYAVFSDINCCYANGLVSGSREAGAMFGSLNQSSVTNSGIQADAVLPNAGSMKSSTVSIESVDAVKFTNGEVAHRLQGSQTPAIWGHTIDSGSVYPQLITSENGAKRGVQIKWMDDRTRYGVYSVLFITYSIAGGPIEFPPYTIEEGFKEWRTLPDGAGDLVDDTTVIEADSTFYTWGKYTYHTVTFNKNGGGSEANPATISVEWGQKLTAMPVPPTSPDGYYFSGWNTADDGTGLSLTTASTITEDITVYAQWAAVSEDTRKVTFDGNYDGGDYLEEIFVVNGTRAVLPVVNPIRENYTFIGWYQQAEGIGATRFTNETIVEADITVYARWSAITEGSGSAADPYLIGTADQLRSMSFLVSNAGAAYSSAHYKLTQDIDLGARWTTNADGTATLNEGDSFYPIGSRTTGERGFRGVFDGGGHAVSGLFVSGGYYNGGLFGYLYGAVIKDTIIADAFIFNDGVGDCGGLAGQTVDSTVIGCANYGRIFAPTGNAGGIVGNAQLSNFIDCHNAGHISGGNATGIGVGGIAGRWGFDVAAGTFLRCYNLGKIEYRGLETREAAVGGLIGIVTPEYGQAFISECYNAGELLAEAPPAIPGSLIGIIRIPSTSTEIIINITNCYSLLGTASQTIGNNMHDAVKLIMPAEHFLHEGDIKKGAAAYLLQGNREELIWGHTTVDGTEYPRLASSYINLRRVVKVEFYADNNDGLFKLLSTGYAVEEGSGVSFPDLAGVTWLDGRNKKYTEDSVFSTDLKLYASREDGRPFIIPQPLDRGAAGAFYSAALGATGKIPMDWSIVLGKLPAGLTLSQDGIISGVPTTAGSFDFTLRAANEFYDYDRPFVMVIDAEAPPGTPPSISAAFLPDGALGADYIRILTVWGSQPITWSLEEGDSLPEGLMLSSDGIISGIPGQTGTFSFTVRAQNEFGEDFRDLSIVIIPADTPPSIITDLLPDGIAGAGYYQLLEADGTGPITWSLEGGSSLPEGLTLSPEGAVLGVPATAGEFSFTVKAANAAGSDIKTLAIVIHEPSSGIIARASYGGAITGEGPYIVSASVGGYVIDKLWVDGEPVPAAHGLVTFQVDIAASSIFATFAYTVNFNQPADGTLAVVPAGGGDPITSGSIVRGGERINIKAVANSGYKLASLTINGVNVTADYDSEDGYTCTAGKLGPTRILADGLTEVGIQGAMIAAGFEPADTTKPQVESIRPSGAGVPITTNQLAITFSKPMDVLMMGTVTLNNGAAVSAPVWSSDKRIVTYNLSGLARSITYSVTIRDFKDAAGNVMNEMTGSFTTSSSAGSGGGGGGGGGESTVVTVPAIEAGDTVVPHTSSDDTVNPDMWQSPFADVHENDWFYRAVAFAVQNQLLAGTSAEIFAPNSIMTRAMLVTVLHRLAGEPQPGINVFNDVPAGMWYTRAVAWAAAKGVISGYGGGRFGPDDILTREQIAVILYHYAQATGADVSMGGNTNILSYTDFEEISEYAIPAMQWAAGAGLITGRPGGILDPKGGATRAEAASILQRFIGNIK